MSVSWWMLERYALGELSPEEVAEVEAALARDERAARRLAEIRGEAPEQRGQVKGARRIMRFAPALAAAAVLLASALLVMRLSEGPDVRAKGDALTLSVVRLHDGAVAVDPLRLVVGDKYSLQVTCVPPREAVLTVRVAQDGQTSEPFGAAQRVRCANDVPLSEALVFDSPSPAEVCVIDAALERQSCVSLR